MVRTAEKRYVLDRKETHGKEAVYNACSGWRQQVREKKLKVNVQRPLMVR